MARCFILAIALMAGTLVVDDPLPVEAGGSSCTRHSSRIVPPKTIRVFRLHRRGSSIPARVERWDFKRYVGSVMASGAWPGRPYHHALVGSIAVKQYAWWHVLNHQRGYSFRGQCFDITDSDQYLTREKRPWSRVPDRTAKAVRDVWDVSVRKHGRFFRTGWRAGGGSRGTTRDGWHLYEDGSRSCANRGYGWRRILRVYLSPGLRIVEGFRVT